MTFDEAFQRLIGHEKGYANHPDDPGGETMWGVTKRVARMNGYAGDMRALPLETAKEIARKEYWDAVKADKLPAAVRFDVFDASYHSSPEQATIWLQRDAGVDDDGSLGPLTMMAVNEKDPQALAARFNGYRLDTLNDLKNWRSFSGGWAQRIAENLKAVKG